MMPCEASTNLLWRLMQKRSSGCSFGDGDDDGFQLIRDYAVREINALLWLSLIAITALLVRRVSNLMSLWSKGREIPGPPCPSFYGHSKLFSSETLSDFLSKAHEKYGSIVRLWLGPTQLLVSVKDPVLVKDMLVKAVDKLPFTARAFRLAFGRSSIFVSSFEEVQKRREFLALQLNGKMLERANAIHSKVVDSVIDRIESIKATRVLDCRSFSQHMAFSSLGATLFGDAFLTWSDATLYEELLMKIAQDACFWASYGIPPFWKLGFWRYRSLCTRLKHLTIDIMQLCRQYHEDIKIDEGPRGSAATYSGFSFSDISEGGPFLEQIDGHLNPCMGSCGNAMGMMFHGCLTSTGLISNVLTRLVMHPEIQDKIYSEILMTRKRSAKLQLDDVQSMNFLLATVYESARLLPAGPLLQRCSEKHDLNLKTNITIPAGAILVVPVQLVQMDGKSWGSDACQFNPYRFLSKVDTDSDSRPIMPYTGRGEKLGHREGPFMLNDPNANAAFLPFGSGTRACVGQKFAIYGIALLFAHLLQHYEIRLCPGSENDPKPTLNGCLLQLIPSPNIIFVRRS
ncbi:hypothetical protein Scep_003164 [Stephania cephalantha]|uniref:Cytochrome P450 n=1 Tax=Stephania cephalantha TaxID=152367 RepID=A0AAP0KQY0_9MAGN